MSQIHFDNLSIPIKKLTSSDAKIALLIEMVGSLSLSLREDYYCSLVRSIIGQQLSVKAARTIWTRVLDNCKEITPEILVKTNPEILRNAGVSTAKVKYVLDLSQKVLNKEVDLNSLCSLEDKQIINLLTRIKGIGTWTAEMFLIFSLGRLDILSTADVGLQRAVKWLYQLDHTPTPHEIESIGASWTPYRTVASLYLWEAVNRDIINTPISGRY